VTDLARALIGQLGPEDVAALAELLRPHLAPEDRWLSVKDAAAYADARSRRSATRWPRPRSSSSNTARGKAWLRRSAIDRWRAG